MSACSRQLKSQTVTCMLLFQKTICPSEDGGSSGQSDCLNKVSFYWETWEQEGWKGCSGGIGGHDGRIGARKALENIL